MSESVRSVSRAASVSAASRKRTALVQRAMPAIVLIFGVVGTPVLLVSSGGLGRLEDLRDERRTVEIEISRLSKRIEHLQARAGAAKSQPDAVERAARDQLGLVRRTEIVFQFQPPTPTRHGGNR